METPTTTSGLPVKYMLFTHYGRAEFENWKEAGEVVSGMKDLLPYKGKESADSFSFLVRHFPRLAELLNSAGFEGLLLIFFDPSSRNEQAYRRFLEIVGRGHPNVEELRDCLLREIPGLRYAEQMKVAVRAEAARYPGLDLRLRFVTPLDLLPIFARWQKAGYLRRWFMGRADALRYDSPKIIEAIARVRLVGTGIPLFRIDWDAIFRGADNWDTQDLGLFKTCASCQLAFQLRRDDPRIATFLLSASYDSSRTADPNSTFEDWRGAYATRIHPAIPVVPSLLAAAHQKVATLRDQGEVRDEETLAQPWEEYANRTFNVTLARRFYGFPDQGPIVTPRPAGIALLGAHPLVSVISGPFLCLSDGAIMDLGPFSGFRLNVSYIDDHHKYSLHRELRHLTTVTLDAEPLLSDAKLDMVTVRKQRGWLNNLPRYTLETYLPTLLWGCVMDAWINPDPLIKFRPEGLDSDLRAQWAQINRRGLSAAPLPRALQDTLERGSLTVNEADDLYGKLLDHALERITLARETWASLREGETETFASMWARGTVRTLLPADLANTLPEICFGIAPDLPLKEPLTRKNMLRLNHALLWQLRDLIDDTMEYIEWTLNWPAVTQKMRSPEQGSLPMDISWRP